MSRSLPSRILLLASSALLVLLAVATEAAAADEIFVRVRRGDTLFFIARAFDTSVDRIRRDNGLQGDVIHPGQRLVLRGTDGVKSRRDGKYAPALPMAGMDRRDVVTGFGEKRSPRHRRVVERHTGLDLRAREGTPILAAAPGVVRFLGELQGFGLVLILEHDGGWRSVYAPCDPQRMEVEANEAVYEGQRLSALGEPVESEDSVLHFEVRKGGEAVDPRPLLRW